MDHHAAVLCCDPARSTPRSQPHRVAAFQRSVAVVCAMRTTARRCCPWFTEPDEDWNVTSTRIASARYARAKGTAKPAARHRAATYAPCWIPRTALRDAAHLRLTKRAMPTGYGRSPEGLNAWIPLNVLMTAKPSPMRMMSSSVDDHVGASIPVMATSP